MNLGGWIILLLSVGTASSLFAWCIWKVLSTPGESSHLHGFEMEMPDERDPDRARQKKN